MNMVLNLKRYKLSLCAVLMSCFLLLPMGADGAEPWRAHIKALEKELAEMRSLMQEQIRQMAEKKKELAELRALMEQQAKQAASKEQVQALEEEVEVTRSEQAEWKTYDSTVHLAGYAAVGFADDDVENDRFNQASVQPYFPLSVQRPNLSRSRTGV